MLTREGKPLVDRLYILEEAVEKVDRGEA